MVPMKQPFKLKNEAQLLYAFLCFTVENEALCLYSPKQPSFLKSYDGAWSNLGFSDTASIMWILSFSANLL